jgi:hypothetical protein
MSVSMGDSVRLPLRVTQQPWPTYLPNPGPPADDLLHANGAACLPSVWRSILSLFPDPQPDCSLVPTTRSAETPTEPSLIAVPPSECLTSGQSSHVLSVTLSATLSLSVTPWRCMLVPAPAPAPAPAPVPSPSLQGDGMRYTSHQSEMRTTPVSSRLTPSPIHNPRRLSLPARAARPDSPRTPISIFLVLGSSVPQHAKLTNTTA